MNWHKLAILLLAVGVAIALCFDECSGQGRRQPKPKEEPKGPERSIPGWTEASGSIPEDKEEAKKATVFEHFSETAECKMSKPFMVYFYWPDEGKKDKNATACAAFEKNLAATSDFQTAAADFGCYKCNAKDIDKKLKSKYGVKTPLILFFDATGKKVHKLTKFPKSDKSLVKKLKKIKEDSDKAIEKAQKEEEKKDK